MEKETQPKYIISFVNEPTGAKSYIHMGWNKTIKKRSNTFHRSKKEATKFESKTFAEAKARALTNGNYPLVFVVEIYTDETETSC